MSEVPLVSVVIVTYNQEKYIAKAIESALAQKADFKYNIIISDDCSSDSTSLICSDFALQNPERILFNKNKENVGLVSNYKVAFGLCKSKYIAILEGDDFWNDVNKLQGQIGIMERNPEIGLVHTNCNRLIEDDSGLIQLKDSKPRKIHNGMVSEMLLYRNFIISITACFRTDLLVKHIFLDDYSKNNAATIDYSLWTEMSFYTNFFYLDKITATYRVHKNSISNSGSFAKREDYFNRGRQMKMYILNKYKPLKPTFSEIEKLYDWGLCKLAIRMCDYAGFRKYISRLKNKEFRFRMLYHLTKSHKLFQFMVKFSKLNT